MSRLVQAALGLGFYFRRPQDQRLAFAPLEAAPTPAAAAAVAVPAVAATIPGNLSAASAMLVPTVSAVAIPGPASSAADTEPPSRGGRKKGQLIRIAFEYK